MPYDQPYGLQWVPQVPVGVNDTSATGTYMLLPHPVQPYIYRIDYLAITLLLEGLDLGIRANIGYVGGGDDFSVLGSSITTEDPTFPTQITTEYNQQPFYMLGGGDLKLQFITSTGLGSSECGACCFYSQASLT